MRGERESGALDHPTAAVRPDVQVPPVAVQIQQGAAQGPGEEDPRLVSAASVCQISPT